MKSPTSIIGGVITLALLTACSAAYDYADPGFIGNVRGLVTDTEGVPLNHIKVTLDCGADLGQTTVYTSMKGEFIADINPDTQLLVITLEDIDDVMATGVNGVAISGAIINAENPVEYTKAILNKLYNN